MWDTVQENAGRLSHDRPCVRCGHAQHRFLPCSEACACVPPPLPGTQPLASVLLASA